MPRLFIAIPIPHEIKQQLSQEILSDKTFSDLPIRWVPAKNLHITLKFLGDTPAGSVLSLIKAIQNTAAQTEPFPIRLEGAGIFPNSQAPRVVWIGIQPPEPLVKLWQDLEENTAKNGFQREPKPFKAHLTLGRIAENHSHSEKIKIGPLINAASALRFSVFSVDQIQLIQSTLSPHGAEYDTLYTEKIGKQA